MSGEPIHFTIVVPTLDRERQLRVCLSALDRQRYRAVGHPPVDIGGRRHRWLRLHAFLLGGFQGATTPLAGDAGHFVNLKAANPTLPS